MSNKSWPSTLAPREKLIALGPDALTDIELLALFLRTGTRGKHVLQFAEELLAQFGSFDKLITVDHQTLSATYAVWGLKMYAAAGDWRNVAADFRSHLMCEDAMTSPDMAPALPVANFDVPGKRGVCSHVSRQSKSPY